MNTSVPWSIKDLSSEAREAAADAARRAGVPLGDWLDTVIAERAANIGAVEPNTDDRERLGAVATEMSRLAARATPDRRKPAQGGSVSTSQAAQPPSSESLRVMSERLADLERRANARAIGPIDRPADVAQEARAKRPERSLNPAVREAVAEISRRQAALENGAPLDNAPESEAATGDGDGPRRRRWRDGTAADDRPLSEEAARPVNAGAQSLPEAAEALAPRARATEVSNGLDELRRDLRRAIQDIDPRGDVQELNRQVRGLEGRIEAVAAIIPTGSALSAIGDQTREVRDLLAAAAARPAAAETIQSQIADMQERLGELGSHQRRDLIHPDDWTDLRSRLDNVASGSALQTIDRRIQDLAAKIDAGLGDRSPAPMLADLAQRIEHIQHSIGKGREPSVDTRPLEALVRGIGERIEDARLASTNIEQLERVMSALSDKIERSRSPIDTQALEAQISRLGNRLEQSETSLSALDSVERTLGELFTQLEETRHAAIDAAENAARTAARDTLRAAMQNQPAPAPGMDPAVVDEVRQVLADVRDQHDASDRRTQSTLHGLHQTMEKLVDHLTKLDIADRTPARAAGAPAAGAPEAAAPVAAAPVVDAPKPEAVASQPSVEPAYKERFRQERAARQVERNEEAIDSLIEPGAGRKGRDGAEGLTPRAAVAADAITPPTREGQGAASYIAAARRAAQAAQASAATQKQSKSGRGFVDKVNSPVLERAKQFLALRRRPILLSVAALVLLLGALEVVKVGLEQPATPGRMGALESTSSATVPKAAGQTGQVEEVASDAGSSPGATAGAAMPDAKPPSGGTSLGKAAEAVPPKAGAVAANGNPFLAGLDGPAAGPADGLRRFAASGDPAAQYELGLRFAEGRTLNRDPKAAASWFEKAAAQGLAPAQYRIGSAYEKGMGVNRDAALAMSWYGRAADAGNIKAMHNLAVMSADGSLGKSDYAKAASWFGKAAALGVRDSQFNLAILYAKGLGIEQSLPQSYTWFAIAAAQGDEDAGKKRDEVAGKLDAKSLAAAKAAADNFRPGAAIAAANDVAPPPGGWDAAEPTSRLPLGAQKSSAGKVTTM